MSPRAALRLESLDFTQVMDYVGGKSDWAARGLPMDGPHAQMPEAIDAADCDFSSCRLDEPIDAVRARIESTGWRSCIVLGRDNVVLGRLRETALDAASGRRIEDVMGEGPTTVRADTPLADLTERMASRDVDSIVVTDPDGRFLGVLARSKAEDLLAGR